MLRTLASYLPASHLPAAHRRLQIRGLSPAGGERGARDAQDQVAGTGNGGSLILNMLCHGGRNTFYGVRDTKVALIAALRCVEITVCQLTHVSAWAGPACQCSCCQGSVAVPHRALYHSYTLGASPLVHEGERRRVDGGAVHLLSQHTAFGVAIAPCLGETVREVQWVGHVQAVCAEQGAPVGWCGAAHGVRVRAQCREAGNGVVVPAGASSRGNSDGRDQISFVVLDREAVMIYGALSLAMRSPTAP